ncbi:MAG: 3-methyl-2-oxobutanoate hydroxymethyltransferase [Candidatus Omnitrophota bacterium]|jgi:3-methyl-2-oxobutanoate hydroxymethyltransferase
MSKLTIENIKEKKGKEKIVILTCYDYSFAKALDEAGLDMVMVGDSMANVVLGLGQTLEISFQEMLSHTKAVARATQNTFVIADMPYESCHNGASRAFKDARAFIRAGAGAVKVEWFRGCQSIIKKLIQNNIPVMGHVGLTPQTAHLLGGFKVQGKDKKSALNMIKQSKTLEKLGVFSLVLECVPSQLSKFITESVSIPTIGIGAGKFCDGQVLVLYDVLGLYRKISPRFVRRYGDFFSETKKIALNFVADIKKDNFPGEKESFLMAEQEWDDLSSSFMCP